MAKCKFKWVTEGWECPLEALPGEEYCYWHKEEEGKEPNDAKLRELKENEIYKVFLRKAKLSWKELKNAFLRFANLQGANLSFAELQGADLQGANLQGANLQLANFQGADFLSAKLQGASLSKANLEGANLIGVRVDSETRLDNANLTYANLYHSYLDETKTLRNAIMSEKEVEVKKKEEIKVEKLRIGEINEIVADFLKKGNRELAVLDVEKIVKVNSEVVARLLEEGLVRYVCEGERIVFFDRKRRRVVKNPENAKSKFFQKLQKRRNSEEEGVEISELNDLIERHGLKKYLYVGIFLDYEASYEVSYEVYNNLYYFYIQNGRLEEALRMHYRRCEVRRKLLREQGWINCLRSWIYDFFILKLLTGYGVGYFRPLIASALIISIFAFLFWLTNGIVKNVNGKMVAPDFVDYIYHSIITFTSLGYSNIQPNLAVGHIPQVLAAAESILGALMMALLIFTITYRVSR